MTVVKKKMCPWATQKANATTGAAQVATSRGCPPYENSPRYAVQVGRCAPLSRMSETSGDKSWTRCSTICRTMCGRAKRLSVWPCAGRCAASREKGSPRIARAVASVPLRVATGRWSSGFSRARLGQPLLQVVAHAQGIGQNGQGRMHGATGREEAGVDDVEVVDLMRCAVHIERRGPGIMTKSDGAVLVCARPAGGRRWP